MNTRKTGDWYEQKAIQMLEKQGVQILERNFRTKIGEIDIIVKDENFIVFVEVKYRKDVALGNPEESVGKRKQNKICMVAKNYFMQQGISFDTPIRFDVIAILGEEISWYKNAFLFH